MDLHLFSLYPLSVAVFLGLEAYHNVRRNLGKSIRVASFKLNILYLLGILLILYYFSCRFHFWLCYPRYLGITRRSCLEAHMVLDMEYREQERPEQWSWRTRLLLLSQLCPVSSTSLHHYRLGLASEKVLAP
jgi:hypothetical protein